MKDDPLVALGLTRYGARVYKALANVWRSTAAEAADSAQVPRQRVYDVLEDLINRGVVLRCDEAKPSHYQAVEPATAVSRLVHASRLELARREEFALKLADELQIDWLAASGGGRNHQHSGQISLADVGKWRDLAHHSVLATARPPFDGMGDPSWLRHVERLTRSGGTVRCIYQNEILSDPTLLAQAHRYVAVGETARVAPKVPTRMILTDSRRAMLPMPANDDGQPADSVLLIDHTDVVSKLEEEFELLWERSAPLPLGADRA